MLNNRVRFGNMKRVNRAVWALSVILMMVLGLVLGPFAVWCGWVCQVVTVLRSSLPQVR